LSRKENTESLACRHLKLLNQKAIAALENAIYLFEKDGKKLLRITLFWLKYDQGNQTSAQLL
jgi:hypothetical protein